MDYQDINSKTIDRWIEEGWKWGVPIDHDTFLKAKAGLYDLKLTPVKNVPHSWIGDIKGKKILGLASGGGQQMPIFAALGGICTVLDYSSKQIQSEKDVSLREGYNMDIVQYDMTKVLPFDNETFDIIFHPVSNCYVEDVYHIWNECYRILKKGGILLSGMDNGVNFMFSNDETTVVNYFPFNPLKNPDQMKELEEDDGGVQFSHTLTEQIGGQLKAGFRLIDLYEDTNGEGKLHELNIPSFIATKSIKD